MSARLRLFVLLALTLLAGVVYTVRIRHEMADFVTWRRAAVRSIHAEPLYRPEDGHYLFKYFPAFALMMAPFGCSSIGKSARRCGSPSRSDSLRFCCAGQSPPCPSGGCRKESSWDSPSSSCGVIKLVA